MYKIIQHFYHNHSPSNDRYQAFEQSYQTAEATDAVVKALCEEGKEHDCFPLTAEKILRGYFIGWQFDDGEFVYEYQIQSSAIIPTIPSDLHGVSIPKVLQ